MSAPTPRIAPITLELRDDSGHRVKLAGLRQAAVVRETHQGEPAPRVLALHGWLDNANSFFPLMPELPGLEIVALDLPGHGHSDPAPSYALADTLLWLLAAADALEWSSFHLIGHSLGGSLSALLAASVPQRIESLIMIDATGPLSESPDQATDRLRTALAQRRDADRYSSRRFASFDHALEARTRNNALSAAAARLIVHRATFQTEDGQYLWRHDRRLRMASPIYYTEAQVIELLRAIEARTLLILGTEGFPAQRKETDTRLQSLSNADIVRLAGGHHLHMDSPEAVARAINRFHDTVPVLGG